MLQRITFFLTLAVLTCACVDRPAVPPPELVDRTVSELAQSYTLGTPANLTYSSPPRIGSMSKDTQVLPRGPLGPVSAGSGFSDVWWADNGQTCAIGSDGVHGTGGLNRIRFRIYLAEDPQQGPYYVAAVDTWSARPNNGCELQTFYALATAWPQDRLLMFYQNDAFHLYTFTATGTLIQDWGAVPFFFTDGAFVSTVYSPSVAFNLDPGTAGCHSDIMLYGADNVHHIGNYTVQDAFAPAGNPQQTSVFMAAPLSNAKCSMGAQAFPSTGQEIITWTVSGF